MYLTYIKPFFDRLAALLAIVLLTPLLLLIVILLSVFQRGSIFFIQDRPGFKERVFKIIKFRTMGNQVDGSGKLLPEDQRLTKIGRFIRQTSLDELPQLWNVLKGDMSMVGPRPLLMEYL